MNDTSASPALLKDLLGPVALASIADAGEKASSRFERKRFLDAAGRGLEDLSIMERVRHIADALHTALPASYRDAIIILRGMGPHVTRGFQAITLADYVARYGQGDFDASMAALADLTRFGSAEFAIRPFLVRDQDRTLAVMRTWAENHDEHVRRLASEGTRPRLPWAAHLPAFAADPNLAAPILERLRADPSLYVRKSVANHINDITRAQPDWALDLLARWPGDDARTDWIIRHALRTLIKQGHPRALALVGASEGAMVEMREFSVVPRDIRLGGKLKIAAELVSTAPALQRLVIDYRIHYARPGGKVSAKVFKLKVLDLAPGEAAQLEINQTIRDFTTRKHHPGTHLVELIINGQTRAQDSFDLTA